MRKLAVLLLGLIAWPSGAFAYRPFDSTDPAVADLGNFEVELSPVSFRHGDDGPAWISPAARLNDGFARDWEVVLEGQAEHPEHGRSSLVENALSVKGVLQEGSLQDKSGLSVATELSVLLPGINDQSGAGVGVRALPESAGNGARCMSTSAYRAVGKVPGRYSSARYWKGPWTGRCGQRSSLSTTGSLEIWSDYRFWRG